MRGHLPGTPWNENDSGNPGGENSFFFEENDILQDKEYTCPVCSTLFRVKEVRPGKALSDGMDLDLRPRYKNIDVLKYRAVECPICGFADLEDFFSEMDNREWLVLRERFPGKSLGGVVDEGVRTYEMAYRHYKAAIRFNLLRGVRQSRRAYTALTAAWLLRGWREELEKLGKTLDDRNVMSEFEEMKYLKYAADCYLQAVETEAFPMNGIEKATLDHMMGAISMRIGNYFDAEKFVFRALRNKTLRPDIRRMTEELLEEMKKRKRKRLF